MSSHCQSLGWAQGSWHSHGDRVTAIQTHKPRMSHPKGLLPCPTLLSPHTTHYSSSKEYSLQRINQPVLPLSSARSGDLVALGN